MTELADDADSDLGLWTVYDHPTDYPEYIVARLWRVRSGGVYCTNQIVIGTNLSVLRERFRDMGLTAMARAAEDDPKIVETWF